MNMSTRTPENLKFITNYQAAESSAPCNPQIKSNPNIERILSQKCRRHPLRTADLLHLELNVKNPIICLDCVQQDDIPSKNYLQIKHVLSRTSFSNLFSYPVLTDPQLYREIQPNYQILDPNYNKINDFYEELTKQILIRIEESRDKQNQKIKELGDIYQQYQTNWQQVAEIDKLQEILLEENNEDKLIQFISNHILNSESNTQKIQEICQQFQEIQSAFSTEQPNEVKSLVNTLLEEISFFDGNNPSSLEAIYDGQNFLNVIEKKFQDVEELQQQLNLCKRNFDSACQIIKDQQLDIKVLKKKKEKKSKISPDEKQEIQEEEKEIYNNSKEKNNKIISSDKQQMTCRREQTESNENDLLPKAELILSIMFNSQELVVGKNQHEIELKNSFSEKISGFAYLNFIMEPLANYIIQVKLEQTKGQDKNFRFGLIRDLTKDKIYGPYQISYSEQWNKGEFNTLIKGNHKVNALAWEKERSLEVRINISQKIMKIACLPDYESVVEIDNPQKLVSTVPFRFYLYGLSRLAKIKITKLVTVREFDEKM